MPHPLTSINQGGLCVVTPNALFYGDNLRVLRERLADESVDLIYLDPPFNSNANYNVLFREKTGEESPAQIRAFTDTWEWTSETEWTFQFGIIENPSIPAAVKDLLEAFRGFLGRNTLLAYLVMLAPRLVELRRVLKPAGSIYLHCDPNASHYIKLLMDVVFGAVNFRNEITWQRTESHNTAQRYGNIADTLLFYSKADNPVWNGGVHDYSDAESHYSPEQLARFRHTDDNGRRYRLENLTAPRPDSDSGKFEWRGTTPGPSRGWGYRREQLEEWWAAGRIQAKRNGAPRLDGLKVYLDEAPGKPLQNIWTDIRRVGNTSAERLGYPTQKPEALLSRIIQASSNPGGVVLDPFCGCGTAVAVAQQLQRRWIGIDITHLAVALMKHRLRTAHGLEAGVDYAVAGEPQDAGSARALWEQDPYQFQFWAVSLLEAQPRQQPRRGPDRGIDGLLYFIDGPRRTAQKIVIQVKGGRVSSPQIRDLKGVVEREQAALGLFLSLDAPTREMRAEEASGGFYHSDIWGRDYPKIQLRTIGDLFAGHDFDLPPRLAPHQSTGRARPPQGQQPPL